MEYQYPFSIDWTTEEVIDVISFFEAVEKAYERGIKKEDLMGRYRKFKEIVPSKSEEKKICSEFEESSGYSSYHVVKKMKETGDSELVAMK
ncbi:hypothetical protein AS034_09600 [[Bacillus] enclensis]|uniref:UPF0223 protein GA0061094_1995 n=1 Tax=[Bacillus] enclensis TaxID=1402860 RepID=A0A0V8HJN6_9BACI|nr:UPF0223 family protein [[Bacillus] enclensis]KSU62368.1 hypothetical protein AS034_09600 [[Bacillus] enclensis]OAT83313.1 hypothetical protein A6P54_06930 [Bacillus sp. MKU004]QTC42263.1 UPF0223 family protein [Bacillus sp. V3]SCC03448.1 Uncharacterized protein YktA, UPF0223 family [[Bacillus] enclensis]